MCKTEEDAIQQGRKISIKQPAGSWSKPLECFRGRGMRYWSNNEPRLPGGMKIEEIQQQSKLKKKKKESIDRVQKQALIYTSH